MNTHIIYSVISAVTIFFTAAAYLTNAEETITNASTAVALDSDTVSKSYFYGSAENGDYTYDDEDGDYYSNPSEDYNDTSPELYGDISRVEYGYDSDYGKDIEVEEEDWEGFDGFICGDGTRIGKSMVCDGFRDCFDCSDEMNCTARNSRFFFCHDTITSPEVPYDINNPRCIPMEQFCDGKIDCKNEEDEIYSGVGFKCTVKDRYRTCVLPERLLCDGVPNCEDRSDMCEYDVITNDRPSVKSVVTSSAEKGINFMNKTYKSVPKGLFQCISTDRGQDNAGLISQNQVCDDQFDCSDLSDECLCEYKVSQTVRDICNGLCTVRLWENQAENENCKTCAIGQIFWKIGTDEEDDKRLTNETRRVCFTSGEVLAILHSRRSETRDVESPGDMLAPIYQKDNEEDDVIICIDQSVTKMVRAKKCDGRPECLFGEDECGISCKDGGDDQEWVLGSGETYENDPQLCRLLLPGVGGYSCLSNRNMTGNSLREAGELNLITNKVPHVVVCDGYVDCQDGSDESYCTTKLRCENLNSTNSETYDLIQQCDGFEHCSNGADELPEICSSRDEYMIPCGKTRDGDAGKYFNIHQLINAEDDCPTRVDECPPFLHKSPEIRSVYSKDEDGEEIQPPPTFESGISNHDRAIDNLSLQIFLVAVSFIGLSALAVSLVLVFYYLIFAWRRFSNSVIKSRETWLHNSLVYLRESFVYFNITVSKTFVCAYFAYIKITRSEDTNYSTLDLKWRSSDSCKLIGAVCFIGTQVPLLSLATFSISYVLSRACCGRKKPKREAVDANENGDTKNKYTFDFVSDEESKDLGIGARACVRILIFITWIFMLAITWLPVLVLVGFITFQSDMHARTQTYAWVVANGAPAVLRANLLDQEKAAILASNAVTLSGRNLSETIPSSVFSFDNFADIINSVAPSLRVQTLGSYGYCGQSGACLPAFLVHAKGGVVPYDMAVSNEWTWVISITVLAVDLVLILLSAILTILYGAAVTTCDFHRLTQTKKNDLMKNQCRRPKKVLNSTFSSFVLVESLTWLSIIMIYVVKSVKSNSISDYNYMVFCLVVLGLNCGIFTPFLLLRRKFRLETGPPIRNNPANRISRSPDATRIIEVAHDPEAEERKPLTNGTTPSTEHSREECQNLMKEKSHDTSPV